ncbi:MAG: alpha/beta hydrolase [Bacteroidota bacterium]
MSESQGLYYNLPVKKIDVGEASIAIRQIGKGPDFLFIHGFPTHGYTWRHLLPTLSAHFTCHILDLPGLGNSEWSSSTKFSSGDQAEYITRLLEILEIDQCHIIAHDSGATVARALALKSASTVKSLILLNTEMPFHRPPWIPFYQRIGLLPGVTSIIRRLLKQKWFLRSSMGFRELYADKSLLEKRENIEPYISQIIKSKERAIGAFKYLKGIDWQLIDEFVTLHREIEAKVLFIWGVQDKTFPISEAIKMKDQFKPEPIFIEIPNASLLPHEEKPDEVAKHVLRFLQLHRNQDQ